MYTRLWIGWSLQDLRAATTSAPCFTPPASKQTRPSSVLMVQQCENDSTTATSSSMTDSWWVTLLCGASATPESMTRLATSTGCMDGPLMVLPSAQECRLEVWQPSLSWQVAERPQVAVDQPDRPLGVLE